MQRVKKVRERNARELAHAQCVLIGVTFRWEWHGSAPQASLTKRWYYTMPDYFKGGYISGPYHTKHEAVERACINLGIAATGDTDRLPDGAIVTASPTGRVVYGDDHIANYLPPR